MVTLVAVLIMLVAWGALALYARLRMKAIEEARRATDGRVVKARSAHASRANKKISEDHDVFVPYALETEEGVIDTTAKYIGIVAGKSCEKYGIRDGSIFLGDVIEGNLEINAGDFVVVNGEADQSNVGERIRRVERVNDATVEFVDHRSRPKDEVIAKITHILAAA
ncbi:hypothetical protein QA648_27365 (plasmid) [Rhizobium sp. CB3171]|uniref:hypothetical protein n=1 Tax=Rhizobium sp. CB3171 TaxID=3039157 RepID=UPI0024B14B79|nr:hypothetical protein [Rhizobium sp. CB3171]WFU04504.1 hypothetical protein QA648_27365 [Rhizobium sp. CB3171]